MGEKSFTYAITQQKQTGFPEEGYVVLKNFLNKMEIAAVQNEVETVIAERRDSTCVRPNNTLLPLRWNDSLVAIFLKSKYRIQTLKNAIEARDIKWISGYLSIKEPNSEALWWHQDWWCWQHPVSFKKASSQIALMCYLSSTNKKNGALRVLPGSHHKSSDLHNFLPEAHADSSNYMQPDHVAMIDHLQQVTLNLNVGDAVAIDYRLLHGTHRNSNDNRRDCVMLTFAPSWRELPEDIKGHLINHYALPYNSELPINTAYQKSLLPTFGGKRKDLMVNRVPPGTFEIT